MRKPRKQEEARTALEREAVTERSTKAGVEVHRKNASRSVDNVWARGRLEDGDGVRHNRCDRMKIAADDPYLEGKLSFGWGDQ